MYIKINGSDERYDPILSPFRTQHGNQGIKVMNGMPTTTEGFKVYNDDDTVFSDFSDYTFIYGENEYTTVEETIEPAECSFDPLPQSALDILYERIDKMNDKIDDITPYKQTKVAYYGEVEKAFYGVPDGDVTIIFDNYDGDYEIEKRTERFLVKFVENNDGEKVKKRLTARTNVTVMVQ